MFYHNAGGINSKSKDFLTQGPLIDEDCLALTETWLASGRFSSEFFDNNVFEVFREDRRNQFKKSGGGVLLAVRKGFKSIAVDVSEINRVFISIDITGADIFLSTGILRVLVIYVLPRVNDVSLLEFLDYLAINYCSRSKKLLILGDFNCPTYVLNDQFSSCGNIGSIGAFMTQTGLNQHNCVRNDLNRLLDLVFSNLHCSVSRSLTSFLGESCHHRPLNVVVFPTGEFDGRDHGHKGPNTEHLENTKLYNFNKVDGELLYLELGKLDWSDMPLFTDVDVLCDSLYSRIYSCLDNIVPLKGSSRATNGFPPWYDYDM